MAHWETLWTFHTARFSVSLQVTPCEDDPADNFQFEDHIEAVRNGAVDWFDARVVVLLDGREVGADYLSCCAYTNARDFVTHGDGYFIDMVRVAIAEARKALCAVPKLRCA
jgi:hypothetical protein